MISSLKTKLRISGFDAAARLYSNENGHVTVIAWHVIVTF
jgi:hypothetical protein